jgi:hypothetical protein
MLVRRQFARCLPALLLAAGALAPALRAQVVPKPGVGSSVTPAQHVRASQRVWLPVFHFRSGFWFNLSHFLYLQARLERGASPIGRGVRRPAAWAFTDLSKLSPADRRNWQHDVAYYEKNFAGNDLPYNSFLVRMNDRLSEMAGCPDLSGKTTRDCDAGLAPAFTTILEQAAPIYRAHWWPAQDRTNQAWIARASALVREAAGKPAALLARAYGMDWPSDPIPVDVTLYAGSFGSYSTFDPFHVVISSTDPRNQGGGALTVILDQSSYSLATNVQQAIIDACHQQTKPIPRDLWHALVFYTAAAAMDETLTTKGSSADAAGEFSPGPRPVRQYVRSRGWQSYQPLLERYWQTYLDKQVDMETAIERLVGAL